MFSNGDSKGRYRASSIGIQLPRRSSPPHFQESLSATTAAVNPHRYYSKGHISRPPSQINCLQPSVSNTKTEPERRPKRRSSRTRSSSDELGSFVPTRFLFTPADSTPNLPPPSTTKFIAKKSNSSPLLRSRPEYPSPYKPNPEAVPPKMRSDSDDDDDDRDDDEMIYTTWPGPSGILKTSTSSLRARIFGNASLHSSSRDRPKAICTTPGHVCAGETETEVDEPPRHLPTSRIIPPSAPLVPLGTPQRLTPFLFEFSRLLSIVPAIFGTIYNLYHIYRPPSSRVDGRAPPERVDFTISALWAILTGYQCLCLTTGLLTRWRIYYPPLPTLIRLLALQGICWPATQLTCSILEHQKRPVIVWAVIGTTTCVSRGVQIWVTSNLWWETRETKDGLNKGSSSHVGGGRTAVSAGQDDRGGYWKRWGGGGGKWGGRRWDWTEVGVKCVLPAGVVYCTMAWAEQLRREWSEC